MIRENYDILLYLIAFSKFTCRLQHNEGNLKLYQNKVGIDHHFIQMYNTKVNAFLLSTIQTFIKNQSLVIYMDGNI